MHDQEFKRLIRETVLEKPEVGFTDKVMEAIAAHALVQPRKRDPLLGKPFWIFVALFAVLGLGLVLLQGLSPSPESSISDTLGIQWQPQVPEVMQSTIAQFGRALKSLPAALSYIMLTATFLLLADRLWSVHTVLQMHRNQMIL